MKQALPHVLSLITLLGIYFTGKKKWWGWAIGLGNQTLWIAFILSDWHNNNGLAWLAAALIVLYSKNLFEWRRTEATIAAIPPCPVYWNAHLREWVRPSGYDTALADLNG